MDKKAKKILFDTYWSAQGWKKQYEITPEDFEYAKSKGLMFDNITIKNEELKTKLTELLNSTDIKMVSKAFLSSLTNKRLDWRSGIASYINAQLVLSGKRPNNRDDKYVYENEDLNVLNFERIKWSGVRYSNLLYNYLDLKLLSKEIISEPTDKDFQVFNNIIDCIDKSEVGEHPGKLRDRLKDAIGGTKDQRQRIMEILGCCEILQTRDHNRPVHPRSDFGFVACWRGEDKYNKSNLEIIFGELKTNANNK